MRKKKLTPLQTVGHVLHTLFLSILAILMAVIVVLANTLLPGKRGAGLQTGMEDPRRGKHP